ncbi:hypothetical protein ABW20_dc0108279 [Dactylellina cionopaga]|nr:hypothetical protein ABW20_dc0108279 [Dactylellina cionopaga]
MEAIEKDQTEQAYHNETTANGTILQEVFQSQDALRMASIDCYPRDSRGKVLIIATRLVAMNEEYGAPTPFSKTFTAVPKSKSNFETFKENFDANQNKHIIDSVLTILPPSQLYQQMDKYGSTTKPDQPKSTTHFHFVSKYKSEVSLNYERQRGLATQLSQNHFIPKTNRISADGFSNIPLSQPNSSDAGSDGPINLQSDNGDENSTVAYKHESIGEPLMKLQTTHNPSYIHNLLPPAPAISDHIFQILNGLQSSVVHGFVKTLIREAFIHNLWRRKGFTVELKLSNPDIAIILGQVSDNVAFEDALDAWQCLWNEVIVPRLTEDEIIQFVKIQLANHQSQTEIENRYQTEARQSKRQKVSRKAHKEKKPFTRNNGTQHAQTKPYLQNFTRQAYHTRKPQLLLMPALVPTVLPTKECEFSILSETKSIFAQQHNDLTLGGCEDLVAKFIAWHGTWRKKWDTGNSIIERGGLVPLPSI